jgi:SPP1 gp7 family putative phage head morphogenesis protein
MVRYFGKVWQDLQPQILQLEAQVAELEEPTKAQIWRLDRMKAIQAQAEQEMMRYAQFADGTISAGQRESIAAGERDSFELLRAYYPAGSDIPISFAAMPRAAVEAMVGTLADGSPIMELLTAAVEDAAQDFAETMVSGLAAGWNPRRLARELRGKFGMGLTRSMRIARTEQLRAYRTASDEQYRQSGVVVQKERMATADDRVCMACVVLDGKRYPIDEPMDDHVQGRCVFVPITKTYAQMGIDAPEPDFTRQKGEDWFRAQDEATQRRMMGDAKWEAWQEGQFALADIPKLTENRTWGDSWTPKGLAELVGARPAVPIKFRDAPSALLEHYGRRALTANEKQQFQQYVDELHPDIARLWSGDRQITVAIDPERALYGHAQTNWILLGYESLDGPVVRHEFGHQITYQTPIQGQLGAYSPDVLYSHAAAHRGPRREQLGEDLTMMLDSYAPNTEDWVRKAISTEYATLMEDGAMITEDVARRKVTEALRFLRRITG